MEWAVEGVDCQVKSCPHLLDAKNTFLLAVDHRLTLGNQLVAILFSHGLKSVGAYITMQK